MKDDNHKAKLSGKLVLEQTFKDKIESITDIKYEVSVILIDRLGLKAQALLTDLEAAANFGELQRAVFTIQNKLEREGKKDILRDILAVWRAKTGY
jgi:hypothetical protein